LKNIISLRSYYLLNADNKISPLPMALHEKTTKPFCTFAKLQQTTPD